jgi:uncharacterized protein YfiM (DUF2279 family)
VTAILGFLIMTLPAPEPLSPDSSRDSTATVPLICPAEIPARAFSADPWFSADKYLHFYFSATLTGLGYHVYADRMNGDENRGKVISVSLTALLGLGKEIYDKKKKNLFSWKDLAWDGLGIAAGYLLFINL